MSGILRKGSYVLFIFIGSSAVLIPTLVIATTQRNRRGALIPYTDLFVAGGCMILSITFLVSYIINRKYNLRRHFWKLPAGTFFAVNAIIDISNIPKYFDFALSLVILVAFIWYAKKKRFL